MTVRTAGRGRSDRLFVEPISPRPVRRLSRPPNGLHTADNLLFLIQRQRHMFQTHGVDTVAAISALRSTTSTVIEAASEGSVLIQKNGTPQAVLIPIAVWRRVKDELDEPDLKDLSTPSDAE